MLRFSVTNGTTKYSGLDCSLHAANLNWCSYLHAWNFDCYCHSQMFEFCLTFK